MRRLIQMSCRMMTDIIHLLSGLWPRVSPQDCGPTRFSPTSLGSSISHDFPASHPDCNQLSMTHPAVGPMCDISALRTQAAVERARSDGSCGCSEDGRWTGEGSAFRPAVGPQAESQGPETDRICRNPNPPSGGLIGGRSSSGFKEAADMGCGPCWRDC